MRIAFRQWSPCHTYILELAGRDFWNEHNLVEIKIVFATHRVIWCRKKEPDLHIKCGCGPRIVDAGKNAVFLSANRLLLNRSGGNTVCLIISLITSAIALVVYPY